MNDDWIREPTDPEPARPMDEPEGIPHEDPQAGRIERDADDAPDAVRPLHPDVGGPIGPS
jgi:hypothetical protein